MGPPCSHALLTGKFPGMQHFYMGSFLWGSACTRSNESPSKTENDADMQNQAVGCFFSLTWFSLFSETELDLYFILYTFQMCFVSANEAISWISAYNKIVQTFTADLVMLCMHTAHTTQRHHTRRKFTCSLWQWRRENTGQEKDWEFFSAIFRSAKDSCYSDL